MIQAPNDHDLVINLDGPDGNAFTLMAYAKRFAKDMGYVNHEVIFNNMMAGDYKHLVKTFDHYFGTFVILETTDEELLNA